MRTVDVDALGTEGATLYTIGGLHWLAPEPDMDLVREIVLLDVQAMAAAEAQLLDARNQVLAAQQRAKDGEQGDELDSELLNNVGQSALATVDSLGPQLEKLLALADSEGNLLRGQYHPPNGEGLPRGGSIEVGSQAAAGERFGMPPAWAKANLSAKRAAQILAETLGEDLGRA